MNNQYATNDAAERISRLMRDESDTKIDIQVHCAGCHQWRTIFATVREAKIAGRCDSCRQ